MNREFEKYYWQKCPNRSLVMEDGLAVKHGIANIICV